MKPKEKFSFTIDFQLEVLRFILKSPFGAEAIKRVKPQYLTLIEHSVIAEAIHKYYKERKSIPSKPILKEYISRILTTRGYVDLVMKEDIPNIMSIIDELYLNPLQDPEEIKSTIFKFSAYVELKNLTESLDLDNFNQYEEYSKKVIGVLQKAKPDVKSKPDLLVAGVIDRQFQRQANPQVVPTPYRQINDMTNGGGYPRGSVIVILDKAKAKKTLTLVNVARSYLKMQKNVLYIDTENGKAEITGRITQSTLKKTKRELQSGDFDKLELKHLRKYKRLKVELIVERVDAMLDGCNRISNIIEDVEAELGIKINILIVDYAAKLASNAGHKDDNDRLFNVYVELQNLGNQKDIDHIWTANHITRDGSKHKATRYEENDIAGAISIIRNAEAIWGLNGTDEEEANGIQRLELVVQRDGKPHGRALLNVNADIQRMEEFSKAQREMYDKEYGHKIDGMITDIKKKTNPNASRARVKENGDI